MANQSFFGAYALLFGLQTNVWIAHIAGAIFGGALFGSLHGAARIFLKKRGWAWATSCSPYHSDFFSAGRTCSFSPRSGLCSVPSWVSAPLSRGKNRRRDPALRPVPRGGGGAGFLRRIPTARLVFQYNRDMKKHAGSAAGFTLRQLDRPRDQRHDDGHRGALQPDGAEHDIAFRGGRESFAAHPPSEGARDRHLQRPEPGVRLRRVH